MLGLNLVIYQPIMHKLLLIRMHNCDQMPKTGNSSDHSDRDVTQLKWLLKVYFVNCMSTKNLWPIKSYSSKLRPQIFGKYMKSIFINLDRIEMCVMCIFKHKADPINNTLIIWLFELTRFHKKNVRFVQFPKANRIVNCWFYTITCIYQNLNGNQAVE